MQLALLLSVLVALAGVALAVIYGSDSRLEEYEVDSITSPMGRATGAFIPRNQFNGNFRGKVQSQWNLCPNADRFQEQTSLARCSGFLITQDLVVTTGNCVLDQVSLASRCSDLVFVLNYALIGPNSPHDSFLEGEYAFCKRIVNASTPTLRSVVINITTGATGPVEIEAPNWAIVQIDRPFAVHYNRFRSFKHLHLNERVITVGHPLGGPRKYDVEGRIWAIDAGTVGRGVKFFTSSDYFAGSEGGPVLDTDGRVIGIQAGGVGPDFVPRDFVACNLETRCPLGIREDDADCIEGQRITSLCYLASFLPQGYIEPCPTAVGTWRDLPPGMNENINFDGRIKRDILVN